MLGRTRLYQRTRSPLIQGRTGARRFGPWPWFVLLVILAVGVWYYLSYLR
jgi:hypothetical protein